MDAVGAGVDPGLVGRRVAVKSGYSCGRCQWCAAEEEQAGAEHRLLGIHGQGSYAQHALAPRHSLFDIPEDMSFAAAALLIATGPVAFAQVRVGEVGDSDVVVVPGITGPLGSIVADLAAGRGARVVGLSRDVVTAESLPLAADTIVDSQADGLVSRLRDACGGTGSTVVIDNVCEVPAWDACLAALAQMGRVVISGTTGSGRAEIDTRRLHLKLIGHRTCNLADQRLLGGRQAGVSPARRPDPGVPAHERRGGAPTDRERFHPGAISRWPASGTPGCGMDVGRAARQPYVYVD